MRSERVSEKEEIMQQLEEAREALFSARTLRELKFWQEKINYLKRRLKEGSPSGFS